MVGMYLNKNRPFIIAAVPAYDEEETIATLVLRAQMFVDKVVVCDNDSNDLMAEENERLSADVIQHQRNLGYGVSIKSLFRRRRKRP